MTLDLIDMNVKNVVLKDVKSDVKIVWNIQKDYISVCCTIEQVASLRGYCTQEEYKFALECQHHIEECERELSKHKAMTAVDFTSLVVSGPSMLMKK